MNYAEKWIGLVVVAVVVGLSAAAYHRTDSRYRVEDAKADFARTDARMRALEAKQEEFAVRQITNKNNIAANTEVLKENALRMEVLCMAILKKPCIPAK